MGIGTLNLRITRRITLVSVKSSSNLARLQYIRVSREMKWELDEAILPLKRHRVVLVHIPKPTRAVSYVQITRLWIISSISYVWQNLTD